MNRTFCFVPVRKGSRGIPGKNLRLLGDKPLVCWIIDTILASGIADEVCVATNCDEMESLIRGRYKGVVQIFRRSEWSARDEASSLEVVQEYLGYRKPARNDDFVTGYFSLYDCTRTKGACRRDEKGGGGFLCCLLPFEEVSLE